MKRIIFFLVITGICAAVFMYYKNKQSPIVVEGRPIRFIPIGDSYTIGEAVSSSESYPQLLTEHLRRTGYNVELIVNPAKSGYTTADAIQYELPVFTKLKPDFATLLIGANDFASGIDEGRFRSQFVLLADRMLGAISNKKNLIVLTIPDFSVTEYGREYGNTQGISEGIARFNAIIKEESEKRGLRVIDLFEVTKEMGSNKTLVSSDGLHPSGAEYAVWEQLLYPEAVKMLQSSVR